VMQKILKNFVPVLPCEVDTIERNSQVGRQLN
jgi:hypothetical protein